MESHKYSGGEGRRPFSAQEVHTSPGHMALMNIYRKKKNAYTLKNSILKMAGGGVHL